MKIAVTDACIFIDLIELEILSEFFELDIEIHTSVEVLNELFPNQKQILKAYESANYLVIHNLGEADFNQMSKINFPRGLSQEDKSVIYLALKLESAIVLSSDKVVRSFAGKQSIEYHGLFWIFDELVSHKIISKSFGANKLNKLLSINTMYTGINSKKEIDVRISKWKT